MLKEHMSKITPRIWLMYIMSLHHAVGNKDIVRIHEITQSQKQQTLTIIFVLPQHTNH
jgi:hypothetical protein